MNRKITAIVVTYNRKDLLCECLQALLAQSRLATTVALVNLCLQNAELVLFSLPVHT